MKFSGVLTVIFWAVGAIAAQSELIDWYPQRTNYFTDTIYRKPTEKELRSVAVDSETIEKYRPFLSQPTTGIFRLIPDRGCQENKNVIVATAECLKYTLPGGGSGYSFRRNTYRIWRLSDLTYREGVFFAGGRYAQGIIGVLGDVDLAAVSLGSNGVRELSEYEPASEYKEVEREYKKIERAFVVNGVIFSNKLKIKEKTTYVLRSIAYRGKSYVAPAPGVVYDEFEFDKRFDILVAFRVVKKDADESVVILWKELERKDAPKLIFPEVKE